MYVVVVGYLVWKMPPSGQSDEANAGYLARCRRICEKFGLVSTGDIKKDAEALIVASRQQQASASTKTGTVATDEQSESPQLGELPESLHPLLGKPAPNFTLKNVKEESVKFSDLRAGRPSVLVFYYGYHCSHCVAQLFAIDHDLPEFEKLGLPVIALSADPPEATVEKYKEYGEFHFPVLADPDDEVAHIYGCFEKIKEGEKVVGEKQLHGTFLLDRDGIVKWAYTGEEPFFDNRALLKRAAELFDAKSDKAQ